MIGSPVDVALTDGYRVRSIRPSDAQALTETYVRNREHLRPWEPVRDDGFFTVEEQARRIAARLASDAADTSLSLFVVDDAEAVVGSVNVNDVVYGAFRNGHVGYWLDAGHTGRGLMTAAVAAVVDLVAGRGLHRLQAGTLLHNASSQSVLHRTGFTEIGVAEAYLLIEGKWQDHLLFQRILG